MKGKIKSEGKCLFCEEKINNEMINRHLDAHLNEKANESVAGKSFLLKVESNPKWNSIPFFLSLWVDGEAKLEAIDLVLRKIWLECCGHLSAFIDPKKRKKELGEEYCKALELRIDGQEKEAEKIKPAMSICSVCFFNKNAVFCVKCAQMHAKDCYDFFEYAIMPVVNSPRMGICGYEGGLIDKKRDGIFKK